jgi:hypothetical protein
MAKSERAAKGGGREVAISASASYQIGATYGASGAGAAWFGPGQPMSPQAPPEVKGRAFDFPQGTNTLVQSQPTGTVGYQALRAFADSYDLLRLIIETRKDAMARMRWVIQSRDPKEKLSPQSGTRSRRSPSSS